MECPTPHAAVVVVSFDEELGRPSLVVGFRYIRHYEEDGKNNIL